MILSDRSIREELANGRIVIEPLDESCIQPSSVDLHIDRYFRVFRNHTMGYIDVKQDMEELTELVEIKDDDTFILHPGEFVLGSTAERVALPDDLVARLEGKALAFTTEVPTPCGWRTMGDLNPGDRVFDETGAPCSVVAVSEVMLMRQCREVLFSDGTAVVADAQHLWRTVDKNGRRYGERRSKVLTTDEIAERLVVRGERNHQVDLTEPIQYPEKVLPVDPYVLGAWLGDGISSCADITTADQQILDQVAAAGYEWHRVGGRLRYRIGGTGDHRDAATGRYAANGSLNSTLRAMGLLGHKHIPAEYLTASVAQRQALLEGLMDTDGYADKWGRCEFTTIREPLAEQVAELVASLGFRPVIAKKRAMLHGIDCGPKFDVTFTPDRPVFRLSRKLVRQKTTGWFHRFRAIVAVRPAPTVPVRCIQVDSPNGMFLITRSFIPTHNSSLGRLGLLIHSSLPGDESVLVLQQGSLEWLPIERVVRKEEGSHVVAFDRASGAIALHVITGRYEGPPDRIYDVRLASGRAVRVTAGHNLFTRDPDVVRKIRTAELTVGTPIAVSPPRVERNPSGEIAWDAVVEVRDTGVVEPIYDLEVRPGGRKIENFLAGTGGVFVSNTAGFVDAGWDGHLTLELSNVANLPITLYPGMKIGQISFLRMTTAADQPYGSTGVGSKYQGQRGPTPSRYFENFRDR